MKKYLAFLLLSPLNSAAFLMQQRTTADTAIMVDRDSQPICQTDLREQPETAPHFVSISGTLPRQIKPTTAGGTPGQNLVNKMLNALPFCTHQHQASLKQMATYPTLQNPWLHKTGIKTEIAIVTLGGCAAGSLLGYFHQNSSPATALGSAATSVGLALLANIEADKMSDILLSTSLTEEEFLKTKPYNRFLTYIGLGSIAFCYGGSYIVFYIKKHCF